MEISELVNHPERLDRDTLYELRAMVALHPYFQTARLLMLQALYLLHDTTFDEELRKAAIYVTDRRVLFNMLEAAHYQLEYTPAKDMGRTADRNATTNGEQQESRTNRLINNFLETIPEEDNKEWNTRKLTPADASVDYIAYLLSMESEDDKAAAENDVPRLKGQNLIDNFLEQEKGRIVLADTTRYDTSDENDGDDREEGTQDGNADDDTTDEEYFTETLARIFIKQGRYQKALDIITRLHDRYPKKNNYFGDQMRFLEKLIIINNNNKQKTVK